MGGEWNIIWGAFYENYIYKSTRFYRFKSKLYEEGKLSLGEAAQLAELSKRAFIEILGRFDISLFNYNTEELRNDVKNA